MAKIKDPAITLAPSYKVPDISVVQKSVTKAAPPRVIPSGKSILAQAYGELGRATGNIARYLATTQGSIDNVEASDRLADLKNDLNQHYINNIAPRRSGDAKNLFKHEVETMAGVKEAFLVGVEGNKRLHDTLALEFDKVSQTHLQKVFKHKVIQDATYAKDTAYKVAKTLQSEMSTLTLDDSNRALDISNQLDTELNEYPELREAAKITAWKGMFKFNARRDPELTQKAYENKTMRKSIVNQIGSEGYSLIQTAIDKGRSIGIQDNALAKQQKKEAKDEHTETTMKSALHLFFTEPEKFDASYIDKLGTELNLPTPKQLILKNLLTSITDKKLKDVEVDWPKYNELLEEVRRGKLGDLSTAEVGDHIVDAMNRDITIAQGQYMLKALANRDVFDRPAITSFYDDLERMRKNDEFDSSDIRKNQLQHMQAVRELTAEVLKTNGDSKKVQEFYDNILIPPIKKGWWKSFTETMTVGFTQLTGIGGYTATPRFKPGVSPTIPFMREDEITEINDILWADGIVDPKTKRTLNVYDLSDAAVEQYLDWIRSPEYLKVK